MSKVLIVDDEPDMLSTCKAILSGINVRLERNSQKALERLRSERFDLLITDIKMSNLNGIDLLKAAKEMSPGIDAIVITAYPDVDSAIESLRSGALDYLIKPFHPEDLRRRVLRALEERRLKRENKFLARHVGKNYVSTDIVAQSFSMQKVLELIDKIAPTQANVLIIGESGTGKELAARRIHALSGRKGPFVPVDCGAIPETLLENELFGHERGAFTDAATTTMGLLEFAQQGTFFMDEVCELALSLQAKLLRVLQERQFRRVGGHDILNVDIRVIAATNKDIEQEMRASRFREELYYRLNVITLNLPPLRERLQDIRPLADHYIAQFCQEMGKEIPKVEDEFYGVLSAYSWPGNIRELQNVLKKALVLAEGTLLTAENLPDFVMEGLASQENRGDSFSELKRKRVFSFEKNFFVELLKKHCGNAKTAALEAGLPQSTFYWYLKKHQIKPQVASGQAQVFQET